ncbi:penicillin-binding protein 1A [Sphingobacterium mizutaii NBRC 14946 = DSM 11724]|uniref:Penicillin-binding protein 1A n=2 Tax=Sphingobacterium mizutaii TaxID=1010 RepID=A0AAJ5C151_9SPHI|nr:transglycosylase domain-containing protein [Sphingobacterium mizutaii]GEM68626.1 penicillin-binding protein 1A [Sphingobacterium mizutaii NBRC 14946 = DSM 11724]SDL24274.1 penicillin-binding protein 1A [Sphingobacterium mizutaii]SNV52958.1 Penicillin-binding protein 1A [Sphingobacterium mizutaii]
MFKRVRNKFLRIALIVIYFIILFTCAVQINFLGLFGSSPTKKEILLPELNVSSELFTADSVLIGRYYKQDRDPVPYDSISPNIVNALIATEDVRFRKHHGVDFIGLFGGVFSTLSGSDRGASTITQQLAKNLYRTRYKDAQGLLGKIPGIGLLVTKYKEWMTAFKLESKYSKEEILTMYLNTVSFSNNAYGIKSASVRYFDKLPSEVSVNEAAVLVGMLKGTTYYNPIRNPKNALQRRNVVLNQMEKEGYLKKDEVANLSKDSLGLNLNNQEVRNSNDSYLRTAVEKWLEDWGEENEIDIYTSGLKIYTTIDSRMQKIAETVVATKMKELQQRLDNVWGNELPWRDKEGNVIPNFLEDHAKKLPIYASLMKKYNDEAKVFEELNKKKSMEVFTWDGMEKVDYSTMDSLKHYLTMLNTGMMVMDPYNGNIKVWVGGINHNYYKFDHVNQAKRQAGSTFKPFAYAAALESGLAPCDKFTDKPVKIEFINNKGEHEIWEPKNADWSFSHSDLSLRHAMARSLNTVTAQITEKVGWDKVVEMAHKCGIDSKLESVPSVGLGSNDVSVFEMVRGYSTFMNEGKRTEPVLVSRIEDKDGKVLAEFKTSTKEAITAENAWLMGYMLRGTIEESGGTSQALWEWDLFQDENQIGGKTGTSSDYVDGWYMGVTKDLVAGVWVGCDEQSIHFKSSATGEGSKTALPIYALFMEELYKHPELGVTFGKFPEPTVEITKKYNCPGPRVRVRQDSSSTEGLNPDAEIPNIVLPDLLNQNNNEEQQEETN